MTAAEAVETSVTNDLSLDYCNLDDLQIINMYQSFRAQIIYFSASSITHKYSKSVFWLFIISIYLVK